MLKRSKGKISMLRSLLMHLQLHGAILPRRDTSRPWFRAATAGSEEFSSVCIARNFSGRNLANLKANQPRGDPRQNPGPLPNPSAYVYRTYKPEELLPWDFIDHNVEKWFLFSSVVRPITSTRPGRVTSPDCVPLRALCGVGARRRTTSRKFNPGLGLQRWPPASSSASRRAEPAYNWPIGQDSHRATARRVDHGAQPRNECLMLFENADTLLFRVKTHFALTQKAEGGLDSSEENLLSAAAPQVSTLPRAVRDLKTTTFVYPAAQVGGRKSRPDNQAG